jgi:hypothetical protein
MGGWTKNKGLKELLNVNDLNCQQDMFKFIMNSNVMTCMAPPFDTNPFTLKENCHFAIVVCN